MKRFVAAGIGISVLIVLNELRFLGRTSLALVIMGISLVLIIYGFVLWQLVGEK